MRWVANGGTRFPKFPHESKGETPSPILPLDIYTEQCNSTVLDNEQTIQ